MKAKAKLQRLQRRKNLARAIDLTCSSLLSHLPETISTQDGNPEWHARCARDYAEILYTLSVELRELAMQDFEPKYDYYGKPL